MDNLYNPEMLAKFGVKFSNAEKASSAWFYSLVDAASLVKKAATTTGKTNVVFIRALNAYVATVNACEACFKVRKEIGGSDGDRGPETSAGVKASSSFSSNTPVVSTHKPSTSGDKLPVSTLYTKLLSDSSYGSSDSEDDDDYEDYDDYDSSDGTIEDDSTDDDEVADYFAKLSNDNGGGGSARRKRARLN